MKTHLRLRLLEDRLAPANLTMTNLRTVDAANALEPSPVYGQMLYLRANWNSSAMAGGEACTVRYTVNGFPADSGIVTHTAGSSGWNWYRGDWYIGTTAITVTATVDPDNLIAETNENDNTFTLTITPVAPTDLPSKFVEPIGRGAADWGINNYADVDPRGTYQDPFGGDYTYDGHDARDSGPWGQDGIDKGFPIYAAADGTVTQAVDGNYDRQTTFSNNPANYVRIGHGNNWETLYYHFARNSITVKVGDVVKAGQVIGLMGSSGYSTGCHLHYTPYYRGCEVEPVFSPATYLVNPTPYAPNVPAYDLESFITNRTPGTDLSEHESVDYGYGTSQSGTLYFVSEMYNVRTPTQTNTMTWKWYRPNGTLAYTGNNTPSGNYHFSYWYQTKAISQFTASVGTWQWAFEVNGIEVKRTPFTIATTGDAAIRVSLAGAIVLDERTTPYDFGSAAQGGSPPQQTFTILNHGGQPLLLSGYEVPPGFSIVGTPPASIAAGASTGLTLQMDSAAVGSKFGRVKFATNDPESPEFTFNISGTVTGTAVSGAPVLALPDAALGYNLKSLARRFAPNATVTDSDSVSFNTGSLVVEVAANSDGTDVLGIRNEGSAAGQIGVNGSVVTYGGVNIGTLFGGTAQVPLTVNFTSVAATPTAVTALVRNLTYANTNASPFYNHRYLRLKVTDNTGKVSNLAIANVTPSGVERGPTVPALAAATTATNIAFNRNGSFSDTFGNTWTASVDYGAGGGLETLTIGANKTYTLSRAYASPGTYTVSVTINSDTGGTKTITLPVTVVTPPTVAGFTVNNGDPQRSRITTITVNFGSSVNAALFQEPGAVTLTKASTTVQPLVSPATGNVTSITLTFTGTNGVEFGSLADGYWRINIPSAGYTSPANSPQLRRLFGDFNGDGTVDGPTDFAQFKFGTTPNSPFDYNGDGTIDGPTDFAQLGSRFGTTI